MVTITGVRFEGEDELTLFTCFAEATTHENNTERPYTVAECKGVTGLLIQREIPGFVGSTKYKNMSIWNLRNKWCNSTHFDVQYLRRKVAERKDYYLARASNLLREYQDYIYSVQKQLIPRSDDDGYGSFQIQGYKEISRGHPKTHKYTSSFRYQPSASSDQMEESPNQGERIPRSDDGGYGSYQVPGFTVSTPRGRRIEHSQTHGNTATFPSQQSASSQPVPSNEPDQSYEAGEYGQYQVPGYAVSTPRGRNQTHGYTATFPSHQSAFSDPNPGLQAPFDDSVSNALGALSLSATSLPRGPTFQPSSYSQVAPPQNESRRELSQAELIEESIVEIGNSKFNAQEEYLKEKSGCQSALYHRYYKYYGARGRVRESSPHAIKNYKAWKSQARGEEPPPESSSPPPPPPQEDKPKPKPVLQIGDDRFESWVDYLGTKGKHRCTSRGFPPSHEDQDYGAPYTRSRLSQNPSPHSQENYEAWFEQASKALSPAAAGEEASSSSGKSKSPAYHGERREREEEHERKGQSGKSRGSKPGGSSKQKDSTSKDTQPPKSHKKKSEGSSKQKDTSSKDDTQGGGRRRRERG